VVRSEWPAWQRRASQRHSLHAGHCYVILAPTSSAGEVGIMGERAIGTRNSQSGSACNAHLLNNIRHWLICQSMLSTSSVRPLCVCSTAA